MSTDESPNSPLCNRRLGASWDTLSENYFGRILSPFGTKRSTNALLELMPSFPPFARVLDAGCGNGYLLDALRRRRNVFDGVVGLDLSHTMCTTARQTRDSRYSVIQGDMAHPPFKGQRFDAVIAINSLLSADRRKRDNILRSFSWLLRPGGHLVMLVPSLESYNEQLMYLREEYMAEGCDERTAIAHVYDTLNERLFDPIGGYVTIARTTLRVKLYYRQEIATYLEDVGMRGTTVVRYSYPAAMCRSLGMTCGRDGLYDWFVTCRRGPEG
ncbi:MAG: methyltransferase domain-containing protein [Chitinivibrionales bacterium]|nr:methyltransferase domain-containing protein [Chitinivibrionales bacterium]MBD3358326.1 methyltransferase domain-containing protein [Chitinivibrionales bacterium]